MVRLRRRTAPCDTVYKIFTIHYGEIKTIIPQSQSLNRYDLQSTMVRLRPVCPLRYSLRI